MKNRLLFIITIIIFIFVIFTNWTYPISKSKIEKEVKKYLKEKYHEEFKIDSFKSYNYNYEEEENIDDAFVYEMDIVSQRLVKFKLYYYIYRNNSYENNKDKNLIMPGIYENYIYEYKIREMENKYYKDILKIVDKSSNIEFSLENIQVGIDNILFSYRNDSLEEKELFKKYYSFKKNISDEEFVNTYCSISKTKELIITMDINKEININNIDSFKKNIRELVKYLKDNNIDYYDINMNLNGYINARATRYLDNNKEQIYLVFDYPSYVDTEELFSVIIFDL